MTKRLLAILLSLAMIVTFLPVFTLAEEYTKYVSASGNDATGTGAADAPFATIQKAIDSIPNSGTVILLSDLNVSTAASNNYAFEILDRKDITLDGGGYKVKMNNAVRPFCVSVGKLTLTDVDIDMNGHQYNQLGDGKYTIQVLQDGELVLNDGAIIENAKYGDGFTNFGIRGTATMNDGAIIRNMEGLFGAIRVEGYDDIPGFGNFYMNGGLITGCTSESNGCEGVVFYISVGGKMVMTGGTITGNQDNAYSPGTIFLHANNMGARGYNEFTATGGTITGNSAIYGGVVYTNNNVNKINISGNVNFTGNTGTEFDGESNLYLGSDLLVNLEGGMGENSMVGVYTSSVPSNTADVKFAFNAVKADAGHFISDKMSTSGIIYDDGEKCWNAAGNEIIGYHHVNEENTLWLSTAAAGYAVDISSEIEHGTVTPNLKCFCPGDTVTLTVNPAEGYQLKSLKYNDGTTDHDITKDATTGNYQFTMPAANVTVTAEFEAAPTYAITNGTPESAKETNHGYITVDETATEGETVTVTVNPAEGYQLKSLTVTPAAPTEYNVTFDLNGVTGTAPEAQTITSGEKATKPADPTDTVHTFAGWYKTKDATTGVLSDPWNFDTDTVTADMTLYAQWERTMESILSTNPVVPQVTDLTPPSNAWANSTSPDCKAFVGIDAEGDTLFVVKKEGQGIQALGLLMDDTFVRINENTYKYNDDYVTVIANMTDGKFTSCKWKFILSDYQFLDGTYVPAGTTFKAVYDTTDDANTLTFYYDNKDHSGDNITVYNNLPAAATLPNAWGYNSIRGNIKSVVINSSVAGYDGLTSTAYMFQGMKNAGNISGTGNLNTSKVADMTGMFFNCNALSSLDVSGFDTSIVTNMQSMFNNCYELSSLDFSNFKTSNVTNMSSMFLSCKKLTALDISSFNTSEVENMNSMFKSCSALETITFGNSFDTSKVTNMGDMFLNCTKLQSLGLSSFNTSKVTIMTDMFQNCETLTTLDLSSFNTSGVTKMKNMFNGCGSLETIGLDNFTVGNDTDVDDMFKDCSELTSVKIISDENEKIKNALGDGWIYNGETKAYEKAPANMLLKSLAPKLLTSPAPATITPEKQQDGTYQFTMPAYDVTVTAEFEEIPTPQYKYTEYENWQIKYGNTWDWSDNMEKVEDGLFKIEILWEGTGFNVGSDENPIKKDWYAPEDLTIGEEVIAPVTVDVYLKVIDDETVEIGVGVVPTPAHTHNPVKVNGQAATESAAGWKDYYECDCGALFEDEDGTTPIENLDAWKSQTGNGYIAPIKPTETGTEPTATGTEPTETGTEPTETGTEPTATGTEPTATGTEPTETGTEVEPTATGVDDVLLGDANDDGIVNMKDVLTIRKVIAGIDVPVYNAVNADCNVDGEVNMKDVLELRKFLAGLITELGA